MPRKAAPKKLNGPFPDAVSSYKYPSKRKNNPPAGLAAQGVIRDAPKIRYEYNPHLPPVLRFGKSAEDKLPELLEAAKSRQLNSEEVRILADALRKHEPWLEWSGKREKPWFEVDPVALHIHERISTQAILRVLARQDVQRDLFADPQQEYAKAVQFYQHDVDWSNRMILGDSLQVMASLAKREDLAGKVQMIYIDPPYGIKFSSNFQPQLGSRDVKDRDQDMTREPEMVRAYRDTWTLGVHSYLAYLRDRIMMAKELLSDTGSLFVQMGVENVHLVRDVVEDVFGRDNFVSLVTVRKTTSEGSSLIGSTSDFIIWYGKDRNQTKFRPIYQIRSDNAESRYDQVAEDGRAYRLDTITSSRPAGEGDVRTFEWRDQSFDPGKGTFKTTAQGLNRLALSNRLVASGAGKLNYVRMQNDFGYAPVANLWTDISGAVQSRSDPKVYVVQTSVPVIERCLLMATDPGDLVLDPTCGSGTSAYVAEHWGRRWITVDTSRVALALARQRIMTARFPFFQLRELNGNDIERNQRGTWIVENGAGKKMTFQCKTVPHVELGSIARNTSIDSIFAKHEPILADCLKKLNAALKKVNAETRKTLNTKLLEKQKREGKKSITDADRRRWELPKMEWKEWEAPFDNDPDWPKELQSMLTAYRTAWHAKMDEVNDCIAKNADMEELVDKPEIVSGVVRVAGPFTLEGVIAVEEGPDSESKIEQPDGELETFDADTAPDNAEAHLDKMLRLLRAAGVDFPANKIMKFARLEPVVEASLLHAEGEWSNGDKKERRVAVSIGPEIGDITAYQVEEAVRSANRRGYDDLVFAAFGFDAGSQATIESASHPHLRLHMAVIRPDVQMDDLLKTQPGSQIFTVFSAPRVKPPKKNEDGLLTVEVEGMDVYDPVTNTLYPTDKQRIAAWFLDSDYDGRTFCICQAFFPDKTAWKKLAKALGDKGVVDEGAFEALSGFVSLPFAKGQFKRIAVKMIDPRGNAGMRVIEL